MATLLIANNCTRESGSFMGDQLCLLKTCYLFVENTPNVDHVIMSMSPNNEMGFLWTKFIEKHNIEVVLDDFNPGDWTARFEAWDKWYSERSINGKPFDVMKQCYLRIHGMQRQTALCGAERGLGRRNIYSYWWCGQEGYGENAGWGPDELPPSVDWFDDTLIHHPPLTPLRDVYISPHAKTQGNVTFTFEFWSEVVHRLIDAGVSVTVGHNGYFCEDLNAHPLYKKHWGDHKQWMEEVCRHKLVACGNTGTGWLAAACGVPMITMEPIGSQMPDHRYRECGLCNIVEVVDTPDPEYVARRITEEVQQCVVMTTGCYDILHAGHVRHLERCRAMGTKLIVAMNSDQSVQSLKGTSRPINPQNQRKVVLEALRSVDEVRITDDPMTTLHEVRPNVLAVGYNYTYTQIEGREFVESYGGRAVVTSHGDAKDDEPSTTKIVKRVRQSDVVEICRIGANASVNPFEKLKLMADTFLSVKDLPGDIADLGACRGGISLILRRLAPDKQLHIFDTWDGTPYDDPLCHHKRGEWKTSVEECSKLVGIGPLTWYHCGCFPNGDYPFDDRDSMSDRKFCFVYVDMDTEQATRDAIKFFWPRMVAGGKMVFDDWCWPACAGVEKAIQEMFIEDQLTLAPSLHTCIIEKK